MQWKFCRPLPPPALAPRDPFPPPLPTPFHLSSAQLSSRFSFSLIRFFFYIIIIKQKYYLFY